MYCVNQDIQGDTTIFGELVEREGSSDALVRLTVCFLSLLIRLQVIQCQTAETKLIH